MYNQEIKERFLIEGTDRITSKNNDYEAIFNASQAFEAYSQKDLAQMTSNEVLDMLSKSKTTQPRTIRSYANAINRYRLWCANVKAFDSYNADPIVIGEEFDNNKIQKIKESYFASSEDMLKRLNQIASPAEGYPAAAAICLAWLGIKLQDAVLLLDSEVNLSDGKIQTLNGSINVTNIEPGIRQALIEYKNVFESERGSTKIYPVFKANTPYFLRSMVRRGEEYKIEPLSDSALTSFLAVANSTFKKRTGCSCGISFKAVERSSSLLKLRQLETNGTNIYEKQSAKLVQTCFGNTTISAKDCLKEYEQYKKAFNLN